MMAEKGWNLRMKIVKFYANLLHSTQKEAHILCAYLDIRNWLISPQITYLSWGILNLDDKGPYGSVLNCKYVLASYWINLRESAFGVMLMKTTTIKGLFLKFIILLYFLFCQVEAALDFFSDKQTFIKDLHKDLGDFIRFHRKRRNAHHWVRPFKLDELRVKFS